MLRTAESVAERLRVGPAPMTLREQARANSRVSHTMSSQHSTPAEGERSNSTEWSTDDVENLLHTEVVAPAERHGLDAEDVAAVFREHAEALESDGFDVYGPGL